MNRIPYHLRRVFPGASIALVTALSALYLSNQYDAPVMLFALLLGMAMNFVYEEQRFCPGINFTTSVVLRAGVALLGLRITLGQVMLIGWSNLLFISTAIAITMLTGALLATRLGRSREFGLLTGGSVSICGASAAIAIATVLPGHPDREKQVVFTVLTVTTLSTLAMILYPLIAAQFSMTEQESGIFLGGTIHDVAQVVGAGYSVSVATGDYATITKLYRVLMLVPVFLAISFAFRSKNPNGATGRMPLPWFILGFIACMMMATLDLLPANLVETGLDLSRLCLVMAIAALGMKTNLKVLLKGSGKALLLVITETLLLGLMVLAWLIFT